MVRRLIHWAIENWLVVILLAIALVAFGGHAFLSVNVEAYPDPAPAIVEVITEYAGSSAEEVEREVTIPLEVAMAGMPGLTYTRSKSLFGLSHLRNQFAYGVPLLAARQEVINRLSGLDLPKDANPTIAPTSPTGEIYRYTLTNPTDPSGNPIYELTDLKTLQDWTLERDFRRSPGVADVVSFGGATKRYEIHPNPIRMREYNISLDEIERAVADSNNNIGGDYMIQGPAIQAIRGAGLFGGGADPSLDVLTWSDPVAAGAHLRKQETERAGEIRDVVLASTNNVPVHIGDIVEGGPVDDHAASREGVVVGHHTRMGRCFLAQPAVDKNGNEVRDASGKLLWDERPDVVEGVVLLRKGEQSLPALEGVKQLVDRVNTEPGHLLPGVKLNAFYDRTNLIHRTTETVRENLLTGLLLVTGILFIFLNHAPSALIVAINIPLALLFAFSMLYLRGKSANLLSLGAVDFGIIVDSTVIMVESIYRRLAAGEDADLPLKDRVIRSSNEVERALFYSTIIMVCALLPLFTMQGPEGQIFGPMADTYAFALMGALILALTLSPVLCTIFLRNVRPVEDNLLVRGIRAAYMRNLDFFLAHRGLAVSLFVGLLAGTILLLPLLGAEFMPQLEEGNIYVRGTFPVRVSLDEVSTRVGAAAGIIEKYPEVQKLLVQIGRPDDGTDPTGFYNTEFNVPLRPQNEWPAVVERTGWTRIFGASRPRTKDELIDAMNDELAGTIIGVDWTFTQQIRDNVMETLSGVKGENSIKIFGPSLDELEQLAGQARTILEGVRGIDDVGVFTVKGQTNLEFPIDRKKCAMWDVSVASLQDVLHTAVGGRSFTKMVEGEKSFDITLRWPERLREGVDDILNIPVDVIRNEVSDSSDKRGVSLTGTGIDMPAVAGSSLDTPFTNVHKVPRRRIRDLVTPTDSQGKPDPNGSFVKSGASTIYREQGRRFIAVGFSVRGRDLASTVREAQQKTNYLFTAPYRAEWSGEFQEMNDAVQRLSLVVALALTLILVLLYLALSSLRDVLVVFSNVIVMSIGGIWALLITGSHFNISAGVGFVSILGVGIMNGLLLVSAFNHNRRLGLDVRDAIRDGVAKRVRPLTMTALTAILGLLPAALSTKIGAQTQRPLAIVIVGGMIMIMLLLNLVGVFYSFYGRREPPAAAGVQH